MINNFRNEYFFLSNFYEVEICYKGVYYRNSEAAFHAQKCINDSDKKRFCYLSGPEAKRLGRQVSMRSDWNDIKANIMKEIVYAKFSQNENLKIKLLATGAETIEESNTWGDKYWGTVNGKGLNMLGKILMAVREELRSETNE